MTTENDNDVGLIETDDSTLAADEQAYFSSKGEKTPEASQEPAEGDEGTKAAETAEGADPAPDAAQKPDEDPDHRPVPYGALKAEREKRKELENQLRQMQSNWGTVEQRLAKLQALQDQAAQPKPEAPKGPPNPEEDFIGATQWTIDQLNQLNQSQRQQAEQQARQRQQQEYTGQVMSAWSQRAQEAARESPEFADAYRFVTRQRFEELLAAGVPESRARAQAQQDEFNLVAQSLQNRQDPARTIYNIARARGFAPKPVEAPTPETPAPQRLDNVARGQAANKSLSTVGQGTTGKASLDAKRLGEMSDDEFESFLAKGGSKGFKAAIGG